MKSVIINNMEIPDNCGQCVLNFSGLYCNACGYSIDRDFEYRERLAQCPMIEIPNHGDLIDRDELRKVHTEAENGVYIVGSNRFMKRFEEAPVVVPSNNRN